VLGKSSFEHELLVTSANLTAAGLRSNLEAGIRITGTDLHHGAFVEYVVQSWMTMPAIRMRRPSGQPA
jgi:phosphatidylserine/phosphatidylglycerophosphate/cardiolipin synthase-like enzyme